MSREEHRVRSKCVREMGAKVSREPSFKICRPALLMLLDKILPRAFGLVEPQEGCCALKSANIILLLPV